MAGSYGEPTITATPTATGMTYTYTSGGTTTSYNMSYKHLIEAAIFRPNSLLVRQPIFYGEYVDGSQEWLDNLLGRHVEC